MKANLKLIRLLILLFLILSQNNSISFSQSYELWGLGRQTGGELGNGYKTFENKLVPKFNGKKWINIIPRYFSTIGNDTENTLWIMGMAFINEQKVEDTLTFYSEVKWKSVTTNFSNVLALKEDGTLWLLGENSNSNLPDKIKYISYPSLVVTNKKDWVSVYSGDYVFYAIDSLGDVYTIKSINTYNSFNNGNTYPIEKLEGVSNIKQIMSIKSAYGNMLICLQKDGVVKAKGIIVIDTGIVRNTYFDTFIDINNGFKTDSIFNFNDYLNFIDKNGKNNLLKLENSYDKKVEYDKIDFISDLKYYYKTYNKEYILDNNNSLYFRGMNLPTLLDTSELYFNEFKLIANNVKSVNLSLNEHYIITEDSILIELKDLALHNEKSEFIGLTKISENLNIAGKFLNTKVQFDNINYNNEYFSNTSNYFIDSDSYLYATGYNNLGLFGNKRNVNQLTKIGNDKWKYFSNCLNSGVGIKLDGTIWGIGNNNFNQLNDTSLYDLNFYNNFKTKKYFEIIQIDTNTNWIKVISNENSVYALNSEGEVYTWGYSTSRFLRDSTNFQKIKIDIKEKIKNLQLSGDDFFALSDSSLFYYSYDLDNKVFKIELEKKVIKIDVVNDQLYYVDENNNFKFIYKYNLLDPNSSNINYSEQTIQPFMFNEQILAVNIKDIAITKNFGVLIDFNNNLLAFGYNKNNMFNLSNTDYIQGAAYFNYETDWVDCFASGDNIFITKSIKSSIEDTKLINTTIFPNPSSEKISLDLGGINVADLVVYDILGNEILSILNYTNKSEIDISTLSIGTYTIQIKTSTGSTSQRLLVNR